MNSVRSTRFPELGYQEQDRDTWRIVDTETNASVGPCYYTKAELLADLYRYAKEFGCRGAS